jgi:signal transduction histidine kinase
MKLRVRLIVTALLVAIPVAIVVYVTIERLRARDLRLALDRVVTSQLTDDTRDSCDANANWFLAGPRPDRPTPQQLAAPDADVTAPRPQTQELPFEFFAYDGAFSPLSTAGPRFPTDLRRTLAAGAKRAVGPFETRQGTGLQEAVVTEWQGSPCAALLFRMRPRSGQGTEHAGIFVGLAVLLVAVALIPGVPIVSRVMRLGVEARRSAQDEYRSTVTVGGRDEMSSIAFALNEAGADIRRRATDIKDREDSLRRYIGSVREEAGAPLVELVGRLAQLDRLDSPDERRAGIDAALIDAHTLAMRVQNLSIAATLKMSGDARTRDRVDLTPLLARVVERQTPFARAAGVRIDLVLAADAGPIGAGGDPALLEQAVNNLVDNAIRYNRPGGQVALALDRTRDGRFSLRVEDDGPGVPDDVIGRLNANRRFRGDEGRSRQPGELGLGLAIVREVCDRLGIRWTFRRSARGWFEAELTGEIR